MAKNLPQANPSDQEVKGKALFGATPENHAGVLPNTRKPAKSNTAKGKVTSMLAPKPKVHVMPRGRGR